MRNVISTQTYREIAYHTLTALLLA